MLPDIVTPAAAMRARRGANVLLETLQSEGVQYIFGNPGTTELPLMDALPDFPDTQYILALQEASAVAMADGYAQASGKPGFLNLHTAGGLGHGMGNLINASVSQTPLVVTAGQQYSRHVVSDPLLFGDLVRIAEPAVKWAREVTSASQLPVLVRRAFHDASAAPSGPLFLSLPMDVMEEISSVPIGSRSVVAEGALAGSLVQLADAIGAFAPGRVAVIAGDEIHASNAASEVVVLADLLGCPVFGSSWPSRIPFPTAHPLWAGNLPTKADAISDVLASYDAVFAIGGKSIVTILYAEESAIPACCKVFQLTSNVAQLGRTYPTTLGVWGDIRTSLQAFIPLLRHSLADRRSLFERHRDDLAATLRTRRTKAHDAADADAALPTTTPRVAAREAVRAIGPSIAIVDEAVATSVPLREYLESSSSRQYSFFRGGGLGWGMPAAVGCSLGLGREPVVSLVGDGAAMYSPQALWTAAHQKLPVTFVVMNNREYNVLKNFMRSQTHYQSSKTGVFTAMDLTSPSIDYVSLAAAMGVPARRVSRTEDIAEAIREGIQSGVANLIEIIIGV